MSTVHIIDGSGYIFRAYYAIRRLSTSQGVSTNAVFGFTNMLMRVVKERKPTHLAIAFDPGGKNFRHEIYPDYKGNRPPPPEDLPPQLPLIHEVVDAFQIPRLQLSGYEADDVIASFSRQMREAGHDVRIITGDKDLMQLVDEHVRLIDDLRAQRGSSDSTEVDEDAVKAYFGVAPAHVADVLALAGDTSDNVPGVKGIGKKTAAQLINEFGDLEAVLAGAPSLKQKARRERLISGADDARLSKRLVGLDDKTPIDVDFAELAYSGPDTAKLRQLFVDLEFRRLVQDPLVNAAAQPAPEAPAPARPGPASGQGDLFAAAAPTIDTDADADYFSIDDYSIVDDKQFSEVSTTISPDDRVGLFAARDNSDDGQRIVGVGLAVAGDGKPTVYYWPWQSNDDKAASAAAGKVDVLSALNSASLVIWDAKGTLSALLDQGAEMLSVADDPMLASYLLDPDGGPHDLPSIARATKDHVVRSRDEIFGRLKSARPLASADVDEVARYAVTRAFLSLDVMPSLHAEMKRKGVDSVYADLELPVSTALARMESKGVLVDADVLNDMDRVLEEQLLNVEKQAHDLADREFNLASPQQVAQVLFDDLGLRVIKRTKTGPSTDSSVLEQLRGNHELPGLILEHRALAKLKGTYIEALPRLRRPSSGRVHTTFQQAVAATGRLSSTDPNLQNIPIRTELGRGIRRAFRASSGYRLIALDYSQIELRILAHVTSDPVLIDTFEHNQDVHRRTAAEIFDKAPDDVSREERTAAKAINFGLLYGMGVLRLARELGIRRREAQGFIERYFERYASVRNWHNETLEKARTDGFVTTLFGRRRPLPQLASANRGEVARAERLAINTPIQGTAADLIKRAMVDADIALAKELPDSRLILQVHDELLVETPSTDAARARELVSVCMSSAADLKVPLIVDSEVGDTWADIH